MIMKEYNNVSKWFVGLSVLLVVVGIVMVVWPNLTIDLLGAMTGICMLVIGLVYVIMYFTKDHMGEVMQMDLTLGAVLAAFGAFMLMHKDFVSMALPFAAGIVLLIGGITKIQHALDMKRLNFSKWQIMLGLAIAMIVLSLVLLYNPFRERVLIYVMGSGMIVNGGASIVAILMISHRLKKMARGAVYTGSSGNLIVDHKAAEAKKEKKGGLFGRFKKKDKAPETDAGVVVDAAGPLSHETHEANEGFTGGFSGETVVGSDEAEDFTDVTDDAADETADETADEKNDITVEESSAAPETQTADGGQIVEDPFDLG